MLDSLSFHLNSKFKLEGMPFFSESLPRVRFPRLLLMAFYHSYRKTYPCFNLLGSSTLMLSLSYWDRSQCTWLQHALCKFLVFIPYLRCRFFNIKFLWPLNSQWFLKVVAISSSSIQALQTHLSITCWRWHLHALSGISPMAIQVCWSLE